jgi:hypothetical protein
MRTSFARAVLGAAVALAVAHAFAAGNAGGGDGVISIDQARAEAGNVTQGDTPGFPVTISQPGSYRLAGNLVVGSPNTTAIEVTADNVTLDLNGFSIIGATSCSGEPTVCYPSGTGDGVRYSPANRKAGLSVRNGTIRGMGGNGIAGHPWSMGYTIERMKVIGNAGWGIGVAGAVITDNVVMRNGQHGIGGNALQVTGNTLLHNGGGGLMLVRSGYGNNTLYGNNGGAVQLSVTESYPTAGNVCQGMLCP